MDSNDRRSSATDILDRLVTDRVLMPLFDDGGIWWVRSTVRGFVPTAFNQTSLQPVWVG